MPGYYKLRFLSYTIGIFVVGEKVIDIAVLVRLVYLVGVFRINF